MCFSIVLQQYLQVRTLLVCRHHVLLEYVLAVTVAYLVYGVFIYFADGDSPNHGVDGTGPAPFALRLLDQSSTNTSVWRAGETYTLEVYATGTTTIFRGFAIKPFLGVPPINWNNAPAGSLAGVSPLHLLGRAQQSVTIVEGWVLAGSQQPRHRGLPRRDHALQRVECRHRPAVRLVSAAQ